MSSYKVEVKFAKRGSMRFISHLDMMRLFGRASRRANLPILLTRGFNPHLKISIKRALKLGLTSENEEAVFYLSGSIESGEFKSRLQEQLPEDIHIKEAILKET